MSILGKITSASKQLIADYQVILDCLQYKYIYDNQKELIKTVHQIKENVFNFFFQLLGKSPGWI